MRGRKPTPTRLKLCRGNPGKRRINDREPTPTRGVPPCPSFLDAEAKKEWRRVARELDAQGILAQVDRAGLAAYCIVWARWGDAEQKLKESGPVLKSKTTGQLYQNPYLAVANKAIEQIAKFSSLFGLDPSSRTRLKVPDAPKENDPLDDFLKQG